MSMHVVSVKLNAGLYPFSVTFWVTDKPASPSLELLWSHKSADTPLTIEVSE